MGVVIGYGWAGHLLFLSYSSIVAAAHEACKFFKKFFSSFYLNFQRYLSTSSYRMRSTVYPLPDSKQHVA